MTEWLDFCDFTLRGPQFLVVDASFLPEPGDGLVIDCAPGDYHLDARVMAYGDDARIARLRVARTGVAGRRGPQLGETWTDTAQTAICDLDHFSAAWGTDDEASYARMEDALAEGSSHGIAVLDAAAHAVAPFVTSGFGDGTFAVYDLVSDAGRAGFEVEFILDDEPYPFAAHHTAAGSEAAPENARRASKVWGELGDALSNLLQQPAGASPADR